ncbi:MAG: DUF5011 domain-containing protein, partial [Gammaproteobacteria bacterium]|nr:DUF5011 domain-containing protein [Gammaproteobacteria bacterium]
GERAVTIGGTAVDTSSYGRYDATYDCSDMAGNEAISRSRAVFVVPPPSNHTYAGATTSFKCITHNSAGADIVVDESGSLFATARASVVQMSETTHFAVSSGGKTLNVYDYLVDVSGGTATAYILLPPSLTSKIADDPASADFSVDLIQHNYATFLSGGFRVVIPYTVSNVTAEDARTFHAGSGFIVIDGDTPTPGGRYTGGGTLLHPNGAVISSNPFQSSSLSYCAQSSRSTADSSARIEITGDNPEILKAGARYVERGATCVLGDGTRSPAQIASSRIFTHIPGTYEVEYVCTDGNGVQVTRSREVRVVAADTGIPTVRILGPDPYHLVPGAVFPDPGAVCMDDVDEPKGAPATVPFTGRVVGNYTHQYSCTDAAGNESRLYNRTIMIRPAPSITFEGPSVLDHQQGLSYTDPGATCRSADGEDLPLFTPRLSDPTQLVRSDDSAFQRTLNSYVN